jgi:hypothetical protein
VGILQTKFHILTSEPLNTKNLSFFTSYTALCYLLNHNTIDIIFIQIRIQAMIISALRDGIFFSGEAIYVTQYTECFMYPSSAMLIFEDQPYMLLEIGFTQRIAVCL